MSSAKTLEEVISKISGVISAKVIEEDGQPREIHVIADPSRNPKQIVRDIETVALASLGMKIDRRIISVAQLSQGRFPSSQTYEITSIEVKNLDRKKQVKVTIHNPLEDEDMVGESAGPGTSTNLPRLVGEAVIEAFNPDCPVSVDDVQKVFLAGREFVLVHLTIQDEDRERTEVGVAPLEGDFLKSVATATLKVVKDLT
ncbi:hypothetical protein THMA_0684 [Thermotoga maritima MSB8]|nr:hypothetical protein [Thermotoga maritima]AGL49594.1 hypothetical protein Tmari_0669 [Thermotoga maritima MSB8]AHD17577.1 hypothetical protein THEMA_01320 [Thermotoga maritima MSB8]AKE26589.1 hypothetical protein THMC_0684 [Thermotoga maritima]AKE28454.1 hypothetical protein THMA_0684 [Thermotoga maritima MSB8]AKE30327.1 hypothetical protein THMB_0684 [Thermotoga maritima]